MNESITIDQISDFFVQLEGLQQNHFQTFQAQFAAFRTGFQEAQTQAEIARRKSAPEFNIFEFLGFRRQELFHSNFLAYLLNPRQNHGQGHLFLETFLQVMHKHHPDLPLPPIPVNQGIWLINREVYIGSGFLDIVMRNPVIGTRYVIENKIDAGEQPDQINRYGAYLEHDSNEFQAIFFLTLNRRPAETAGDTRYYPISYKHEISQWLDGLIDHDRIEALTVRETVRQYLTLIRSL